MKKLIATLGVSFGVVLVLLSISCKKEMISADRQLEILASTSKGGTPTGCSGSSVTTFERSYNQATTAFVWNVVGDQEFNLTLGNYLVENWDKVLIDISADMGAGWFLVPDSRVKLDRQLFKCVGNASVLQFKDKPKGFARYRIVLLGEWEQAPTKMWSIKSGNGCCFQDIPGIGNLKVPCSLPESYFFETAPSTWTRSVPIGYNTYTEEEGREIGKVTEALAAQAFREYVTLELGGKNLPSDILAKKDTMSWWVSGLFQKLTKDNVYSFDNTPVMRTSDIIIVDGPPLHFTIYPSDIRRITDVIKSWIMANNCSQ